MNSKIYNKTEYDDLGDKMVLCPNCESENDADSIFCEKCGTRLKPEKSKNKMTKNKYLLIVGIAIFAIVGLIYYLNLDPTFDNGYISFTYPKGYVIEKNTDSRVYLHNPSSGYNITVFKMSKIETNLQEFIKSFKYGLKNGAYNQYFRDEKEVIIDGTTGYQFDSDSDIKTSDITTNVIMEKNGNIYVIFHSKWKNLSMPESIEKSSFYSSKEDFENTVIKTFKVK